MVKLKFAFMGFRHGHVVAMYDQAQKQQDIEVVAGCEEDPETREALAGSDRVQITHHDYPTMLREVDCDVIAVGDYYARRGEVLIEALESGRHVIADKPLCTRLSELERIESVAAARKLSVGCMLDMADLGQFRRLREVIREGQIGEVHAISFNGQHPMNYGRRPAWYFERGKHGGTLNDIAIHAVDSIPWVTGQRFTVINAARNWNACLREVPFFKDSAQVMLTMDSGCGVLGDVSYLAPDSVGYAMPQYWRTTLWGQDGVVETSATTDGVVVYSKIQAEPRRLPSADPRPGGYLADFTGEIRGQVNSGGLTTDRVVESSRNVLRIQEAADKGLCNVAL